MGVYIKRMKTPTSCSECPMCYDMMECSIAEPIINFFGTELEEFDFCTERHPRCPLVPVPPHGRLKDYAQIMKEYDEWRSKTESREYENMFYALLMAINSSPVIIPTEKCEA